MRIALGRRAVAPVLVLMATLWPLAEAFALPSPPPTTVSAIRIAQAPHVTVAAGTAAYTGADAQPRPWSADIEPLIQATAKRLQNDPDRIYEFVSNAIETEPMFGLAKGAVGTLVNRSGTPFDQAELMVKLLRAAGIQARYRYGPMTLTAAQFYDWQGVSSTAAVQQLLDDGGFPNDVSGSVTLLNIWVEAQIGGQWVQFNPALKKSTWYTAADFKTLMGYNRTTLRAAAGAIGTGATITGGTSGALSTALTNQAKTLYAALNTAQYAQLAPEQVLGGSKIIANLPQTPLRQTSLPEAGNGGTVWDGEIPNAFRVLVKVNGYNTAGTSPSTPIISSNVYGDEYYAAKYRVSSTQPYKSWSFLGLDVPPYGSGTRSILYLEKLDFNLVTVEVKHPYAANGGAYGTQLYTSQTYAQRTETNAYTNGNNGHANVNVTTALRGISVVLGRENDSSVEILARQSAQTDLCEKYLVGQPFSVDPGVVLRSPYCGLAPNTFDIGQRVSVAQRRAEGISNSKIISHDSIAFNFFTQTYHEWTSSDWNPPYTSNWRFNPGFVTLSSVQAAISVTALSADAGDRRAAIGAHAALFTAAELQPTLKSAYRNTPPDMIAAATPGGGFRWITPANVATAIGQLQNYDASTKSIVSAYVAAGYSVLAPLQGKIGVRITPNFKGAAVWAFHPDGHSAPIFIPYTSGIILKGASGTGPTYDPTPRLLSKNYMDQFNKNVFDPSRSLGVDSQTGQMTFKPPSLLTTGNGDFPQKLSLDVKYVGPPTKGVLPSGSKVSGQVSERAIVGNSFSIYTSLEHDLTLGDDLSLSTGSRSPLDAVQAVTAATVAMEEYRSDTDGISGLVVMAANAWLGQQTQDGVATIVHGVDGIEKFVKGPAGTWNPLPDSGAKLTQTGGPSYVAAFNRRGFKGVTFKLTAANGQTKTFRQPSPGTATGATPLSANEIVNCASSGDPATSTTPPNFDPDEWEMGYWGIEKAFGLDTWTFPSGETVKGTYTDSNYRCSLITLEKLVNNYGRYIKINWTASSPPNITPTYTSTGWTDDNGRIISDLYSAIPDLRFFANTSNGAPTAWSYRPAYTLPGGSKLWFVGSNCQAGYKERYALARSYCGTIQLYYNDPNVPIQTMTLDTTDEQVTSIADAAGNVTQYPIVSGYRSAVITPLNEVSATTFDIRGRAIETRDALNRVSRFDYDPRGRRTLETRPEGDSTSYTYDVRSNLLTTTKKAKPASGLADQITSRTYGEASTVAVCSNPRTCNSPISETDALGNVTNYSWNATTGQLTQILQPADPTGLRPKTDFTYGPFAITGGTNISLIKKKTSLVATGKSETITFDYDLANHLALKTARFDPTGLNLTTCFQFDGVGNLTGTTDPRAGVCP
jgi:YD repeat-containing protein